jgi:retron-type reverse transcriptase
MKRHRDLFTKIVDKENIFLAYRKARKGKGWQNTIKNFEGNLEENIAKIHESLVNKTFKTSPYKTKIIHEPKRRIIYRLPFNPDRIVQHALMNTLEPIWDKMFIYDSYACRTGKGIHAGSKRTMEFVRKNRYCLKCDISKFYPSINHDILFEIVQRKIKCKDTLWLIQNIIYSIGGGFNIPIGNYTSQWFGNLYMNELDQLLKHKYHIKCYIRYCDDFLLFHNDKKFLGEMADVIEEFLREKLQLKLSKCDLFPVSRGVDFLGYRHFRGYILVRKSTAKRVKKRLKRLPILLAKGKLTTEQYRSSLASTMGWLKWSNSYNLRQSMHIDTLMEVCNGESKAKAFQ